jgi:hypothetical protein
MSAAGDRGSRAMEAETHDGAAVEHAKKEEEEEEEDSLTPKMEPSPMIDVGGDAESLSMATALLDLVVDDDELAASVALQHQSTKQASFGYVVQLLSVLFILCGFNICVMFCFCLFFLFCLCPPVVKRTKRFGSQSHESARWGSRSVATRKLKEHMCLCLN